MRIALIVNAITPKGGIARVVLNLARNLKKKGHEIQLFTITYDSNFIKWYGVEEKEIICSRKLRNLNKMSRIPGVGFIIQLVKFQLWGLLLSRQFKKTQPDIINSHHYLCGISGWILSRLIKRPHVVTLHGIHLSKEKVNSIYYWVDYLILKFLRNHIFHFIAVDPGIKSHPPFAGISDRVEVIFPCVDGQYLELLEGDPPRAQHDERYHLAYIGRLEKSKGLEELFTKLREDVTCWSELKLIGSGSYEKKLRELAEKLNFSNKIFFEGFLEGRQKVQVIKKSDFFISYSRSEGFPLVILEFFALGKPCIVYPIGGISHFKTRIKDEKLGIFLRPKPKFLGDILTDPDTSTLFSEQAADARRKFVKEFYPEVITQKYIKVFKRIAKMQD
jgi:glycosyltransferase involved in cell wall biosynthesis